MTTYNVEIVINGRDRASGPLGSAGGALSRIGQIAGGILSAQLFTRLADGIMNIGKEAIGGYADLERLGTSLQSMVARELLNKGAVKDMTAAMAQASPVAKGLLGWVQQLALDSPFNEKDVSNAFRMAMAYGFTSKEAQTLTQDMLDFASGTNATGDSMNRIALALGQIRARGKLAGGELMQLTEAGLPVRDILAKAFGVTTAKLEDMISSGLIPADKAIQAITSSIEHDFGGAAKAQAHSFSGLLSSLGDIKDNLPRDLLAGAFQAAQPYLDSFVGKLSSPDFKASIQEASTRLGGLVGKLLENGPALLGMLEKLGSNLEDMAKRAQPFVTVMAGALMAALNRFAQFWRMYGPGISGMFGLMFQTFIETMGWLAKRIIPFLVGALDTISRWFLKNGPLIQRFISKMGGQFDRLMEVVKGVWLVISPLLEGLLNIILDLATLIMQVATGDWAGAWQTVQDIVYDAWTAIQNAFSALADWVTSWFGTDWATVMAQWGSFFDGLKGLWNNGIAGWKRFFAGISAAFNSWKTTFVTNWNNALNAIKEKFNSWKSGFMNAWTGAWTQFAQIVANLKTTLGNYIADAINNVISTIKSMVYGLIQAGKALIDGLWKGIQDQWKNMLKGFQDLVAGLPQALKDLLGIHSPSTVFFEIGANMMKGLANGLKKYAVEPHLALQASMVPAMAMAGNSTGRAGNSYTSNNQRQTRNQFGNNYYITTTSKGAARDILKSFR